MKTQIRGITLIEVLVTITIIGVLLVVAVPSFQQFLDSRRLKNQAEAIADLLRLAKSEAVKQSHVPAAGNARVVTATVSPTAPWFVGLSNSIAACTGASDCRINEGGTQVERFLGSSNRECADCTLTSPTTVVAITFSMRGVVLGAGTARTITVSSPLGRTLNINVSAVGRVSVCSTGGAISGYPTCS